MPQFPAERSAQLLRKARDAFRPDDRVRAFLAPGRVNLIGEHTDYNEGFVLPAALDLGLVVLVAPRADGYVVAVSADEGPDDCFDLASPVRLEGTIWSNFVRGVVGALQEGYGGLGGFTLAVASTIPIGAGLSSSAAIEVGVAFALCETFGITIPRPDLALMCQRVENRFIGVNCGIMDQFVVANATGGHALFLDCRDLATRHVPLPADDVAIVVCDTTKARTLAGSKYNERRAECESAVAVARRRHSGVTALRDVTPEMLDEIEPDVPEHVLRRARHIVSEDLRVLASVDALAEGDVATFGRLMNESHVSLRDDYEVSCPELDAMVEIAQSVDGVLGSRMTGAGFGGCTVSLVRVDAVDALERAVAERFPAASGLTPAVYRSTASAGVHEEDPAQLLGESVLP